MTENEINITVIDNTTAIYRELTLLESLMRLMYLSKFNFGGFQYGMSEIGELV